MGGWIGGALGGMVGNMGFTKKGGGEWKPDTTVGMGLPSSKAGAFDGKYVEGPWGLYGFTSDKHLGDAGGWSTFKPTFEALSYVDNIISQAITPEENQKIMDYYAAGSKGTGGMTIRKERNEGGLKPMDIWKNGVEHRQTMLKEILGTKRYNELGLGNFYSSMNEEIGVQ